MNAKKQEKTRARSEEPDDKSSRKGKKGPKPIHRQMPQLDIRNEPPTRFEKPGHEWLKKLPRGTWRQGK